MAKKCESTFEMVDRLYKEHDNLATAIGCASIAALSGNPAAYVECVETKNKVEDFAQKMLGKWQELTKNAEWAKIGPRQLDFNKVEKGTLFSQGDRKYITYTPCPYDELELEVREHDGKSKTMITFCKIGPKGKHTELGEWVFNDDRSEKRNDDQVARKAVNDAKGYFFVLILDSMSAGYKFDYTIKLAGKNKKKSIEQKVNPKVTVK